MTSCNGEVGTKWTEYKIKEKAGQLGLITHSAVTIKYDGIWLWS